MSLALIRCFFYKLYFWNTWTPQTAQHIMNKVQMYSGPYQPMVLAVSTVWELTSWLEGQTSSLSRFCPMNTKSSFLFFHLKNILDIHWNFCYVLIECYYYFIEFFYFQCFVNLHLFNAQYYIIGRGIEQLQILYIS